MSGSLGLFSFDMFLFWPLQQVNLDALILHVDILCPCHLTSPCVVHCGPLPGRDADSSTFQRGRGAATKICRVSPVKIPRVSPRKMDQHLHPQVMMKSRTDVVLKKTWDFFHEFWNPKSSWSWGSMMFRISKKPSLKLTAKAPVNGWLENDPFLLGFGPFSGANC